MRGVRPGFASVAGPQQTPRQRPSILCVDKVNVADTVYVAPFSTPICSEEKASLALVRSPSHLGACEAYLIILSTVLRVNDVG